MTVFTFNGKTYDTADLTASDGRGYNEDTLANTGDTAPFYIAAMIDAMADAAKNFTTTSVTSLTIGTGSKAFVLVSDIPFTVGQFFQGSSEADGTDFMFGDVTNYVSATKTVTVNVTLVGGSGTKTDWNCVGTSPRGAAGAGIADVVDDTTPQLGGDLDVNANDIISASNNDINIIPNGTGEIDLDGPTLAYSPIITVSGTTDTLALTDKGAYLRYTNAASIAVTVPTNASVAFDIGTEIILSQAAAGVITVDHAGVTVNSKDTLKDSNGQNGVMCLKKVATDTWDLFGDLA